MSTIDDNLKNYIQNNFMIRELENVWIEMTKSLSEIEVIDYKFKGGAQGEKIEAPRWVAKVLIKMNFAKSIDDSFENEILKAEAKEKLQTPPQLAEIKPDFYYRFIELVNEKKTTANNDKDAKYKYDKIQNSGYDLITNRMSKILSLSVTSYASSDLYKKLSPEESELFRNANNIVKNWRKIIGGELE